MQNRKITYKLYPTENQNSLLLWLLYMHKDLWDAALQERIEAYKKCGISISYNDQCKSLTQVREENSEDWALMNCSSQQITLRRLNKAFSSFFSRVKRRETAGFPRFKSIKRMPGFGYKGHGDGWKFTPSIVAKNGKEHWKHGTLRLQGVGTIKARGEARTGGKIKSCELMHKHGDWYLSLTIECDKIEREAKASEWMIADWGTGTFLTSIDEKGNVSKIANHRWFKTYQKQLIELDRKVSLCKKGTKKWKDACKKASKLRSRIARKRQDWQHKTSAKIASKVSVFVTEELDIKEMSKSLSGTIESPGTNVKQKQNLNREIVDTAPASFFSKVAYKVEEAGGRYLEAPTKKLKPSQRCPFCWTLPKNKKTLKDRKHSCSCGCKMERDTASCFVLYRWYLQEFHGWEPSEKDLKEFFRNSFQVKNLV